MVQTKLHEAGLYFGEIDGAYSSDLSAALSRYQIRNGLPITGQLDVETSKALGAKSAVGPSTAANEQSSSETWQRLRRGERQTSTKRRETSSPSTETGTDTGVPPRSTPAATARTSTEITEQASALAAAARTSAETTEPASSPPATAMDTGSPAPELSTERLRDYVGAFVLAGVDPHVGSETDFFADRVQYYDQGMKDREKIRKDLERYAARWPKRQFWLDGNITVEPQNGNRLRVTFPLRYDLRNGAKQSSGKINKTLVLERAGDDFQIVAVNEHKG